MRRPDFRVRQYVPAPYFCIIKAELRYGEARETINMKKFSVLALLFVVFVALSCEEEKILSGEESTVTSLKVMDGDTIEIYLGDTAYINVEYFPNNVPAPRLYYFGYNQLILRAVEENGMLVARKRGTTALNIGVRQSDVSTSCIVNILPEPFNLSCTNQSVYVGETCLIKPILPPGIVKNISWQSSRPDIATVDLNGVVRGMSAGTCDISAVAYVNNDTVRSNKCHITVCNMDMKSLVLSDSVREIAIEESFRLKAAFVPVNTTFSEIYWSSSDTCVATVDVNGNVKGVGFGSCIISATNEERSHVAYCNVVVGFREMSDISLFCNDKEALHHDQFCIGTVIKPVNATMYNKALRWESSDESVATVDEFTGLITCVKPGECLISVYNIYNEISDSCHLVVNPRLVNNIELSDTEMELLLKDKKRLSCTVSPVNATDGRVKWESSDDAVVTIDSDGNVKAIGVGSAMITVTALDAGGCMAQSTVTVETILMEKIELPDVKDNLVQLVLDSVETKKISYKIIPDNAIDKEVEWKSSDESIVAVDEEGNVTGLNVGEAKITVAALDGSKCESSFDVKVVNKQILAEDYVKNDVSITLKDSTSFTIKGEAYTVYTYEIYNTGKENTVVARVNPVDDDSANLINETYAIDARKKKEITLEVKNVVWTFIHNGYECVKEK